MRLGLAVLPATGSSVASATAAAAAHASHAPSRSVSEAGRKRQCQVGRWEELEGQGSCTRRCGVGQPNLRHEDDEDVARLPQSEGEDAAR